MDIQEEATVYAVACESCRTKKCKCDRRVPSCSQCSTSNATCTYPELHKRGFPVGYLAEIERRLIETELALLQVLSGGVIPPPTINWLSKIGADVPKTERLKEWAKLPLTTPAERQHWLDTKLENVPQMNTSKHRGSSPKPLDKQRHLYF